MQVSDVGSVGSACHLKFQLSMNSRASSTHTWRAQAGRQRRHAVGEQCECDGVDGAVWGSHAGMGEPAERRHACSLRVEGGRAVFWVVNGRVWGVNGRVRGCERCGLERAGSAIGGGRSHSAARRSLQ
jgi:hypothetical protein